MKKKALFYAIPALVVIAVAVFFFTGAGKPVNDSAPIKTAKAFRGDLRLEVVSAGVVSPDVEVVVKSKAGGEITEFPFQGDLVNKGQTIVKLDPKTEGRERTRPRRTSSWQRRGLIRRAFPSRTPP